MNHDDERKMITYENPYILVINLLILVERVSVKIEILSNKLSIIKYNDKKK